MRTGSFATLTVPSALVVEAAHQPSSLASPPVHHSSAEPCVSDVLRPAVGCDGATGRGQICRTGPRRSHSQSHRCRWIIPRQMSGRWTRLWLTVAHGPSWSRRRSRCAIRQPQRGCSRAMRRSRRRSRCSSSGRSAFASRWVERCWPKDVTGRHSGSIPRVISVGAPLQVGERGGQICTAVLNIHVTHPAARVVSSTPSTARRQGSAPRPAVVGACRPVSARCRPVSAGTTAHQH